METMKVLVRALSLIPGLVHGAEKGAGSGAEKKAAVLEMVRVAIDVTDAVTGKKLADADGFATGLGMVVDGVVECLKASLWAGE